MATNIEVIRTLTIKSRTEGVQQTAGEMKNLAGASEEVARAAVTQEKATLGVERAYQRLQRQFDSAFRAQQDLAKVQVTLANAQAQGIATQERANQLMAIAASQFKTLTQGMTAAGAATLESSRATEALTKGMSDAGRAAALANDNLKKITTTTQSLAQGMSSLGAAALQSARATEQLTKGMSEAGRPVATVSNNFKDLIKGMSSSNTVTLESINTSRRLVAGMSDYGRAAASANDNTQKFASGQKLARFELINLSRQVQDVGVSLASGQSPFTVAIQQGSQIVDVMQTSGLSFKQFGAAAVSGLAGLVGATTAVVAGVAAIGASIVVAATQFGAGQQAIRQSLTGIGAASGATLDSINAIATTSASAFGLSISEARDFAATLASVGKIGGDEIGKLTGIAKDLSRAFGEDVADTAKRVAQAFSGDLSQAATQFNNRLGSLNATQLEYIRNLQASGEEAKAQAVLIEGLTRGIADQQAILTTSSKFWTALGNAISNAFTKFGEFAARTTGIGFIESTNDEIVRLEAELENLRQSQQNAFKNFLGGALIASEIQRIQDRLAELNDALLQTSVRAIAAKSNLDSIKAQKLIDQQLPEIIKKQDLENAVRGLQDIKRLIDEGKLSFEGIGRTAEQFAAALQKAQSNLAEFKTPIEQLNQAADLQLKAATALGPVQKAQIEFERERNQLINQGVDAVDAISLAEKKRQAFLKQFNTEEGEAAKARKLSNQQQQEAAELEITLINKTAGEQARLRQQMQNRHQLEQAALAKSIDLNEEELDTLNKQSASLETLVNQRERMQQLNQATTAFVTALATGFARGDSAAKSLSSALQSLGQQLISIGAQDIGKTIANALSSVVGAIPGLGGITSIAAGIGVSLISRLFGSNDQAAQDAKKQQEELQKAKDAFAAMTKQLEDFNRAAAGLIKGELRTNIEQLEAQRQPLAAAALKAENFAAFARIQATFAEGVARLVSEFSNSLPALHAMLQAEGGLSGARAQAIAAVKNFREQVLGLKDSIEQASLAASSSEILSQWDIFANEAQNAALAMLDQAQAQNALIVELKRIKDTAAELQAVLVELGMSAEDAAAAIEQRLGAAIDKLRQQFIDDLIREVNKLAGADWINQVTDLVKQIAQLRADATALGISTALIDNFYALSAAKIIHENELVGASLEAVATMTGFTAEHLKELADAMEQVAAAAKRSLDEINSAIQSNEDRLFLALHRSDSLADQLARFDLAAQREREAEMKAGGEAIVSLEAALAQERLNIIADFAKAAAEAALEAQKDALRAQISALEDQIRITEQAIDAQKRLIEEQERALEAAIKIIEDARNRINAFVAGFLGGTESFLSPREQMNTAITTFNQQRAAALGGDQEALQNITTVAQNALDAIKRFYGSSTTGVSLQQQIINQLTGLPALLRPEQFIVDAIDSNAATQLAALQQQLAAQQQQLAALNQQLTALNNVNTNVAGVNTDTNSLPGIATETGETSTNTGATKTALDVANSQLTSINNAVINLVQIQSRQIETNEHLFAIRRAINQQNLLWPYNPPNIIALPTFKHGGVVFGRAHDAGGQLIMAEGGEYVMAKSAVKTLGLPFLNAMNYGGANDNFSTAMVSSIRNLERSMLRGMKAMIEAEFEAAGIVVRPLQETSRSAKARRGERKAG